MELTFAVQTTAFAFSIIPGLALGIIYGVFKIFRICVCSGKASVYVCDILFMLISSLVVFYFSVAFLCGYVRVYVFIGCLLGFALYRVTLGRLLSKLYCPVINFIKKILGKLSAKIKKIMKKLLKIAYKILYNIINKIKKYRSKRIDNKKVMTENEKEERKNSKNRRVRKKRLTGNKRDRNR